MDFAEIYQHHKNMVYNLALGYVQNVEDAEEITQDVFLSIYEGLDHFRGDAKLSTWIYRITINKSLDFIKSKRRKKRMSRWISLFKGDGYTLMHDATEFNHPGILMEQQEEMQRIFFYLNQLPPSQKTVLVLAKLEKKSHAEIAEILNVSSKAVESLLQRAKSNLSQMIKHSEGSK